MHSVPRVFAMLGDRGSVCVIRDQTRSNTLYRKRAFLTDSAAACPIKPAFQCECQGRLHCKKYWCDGCRGLRDIEAEMDERIARVDTRTGRVTRTNHLAPPPFPHTLSCPPPRQHQERDKPIDSRMQAAAAVMLRSARTQRRPLPPLQSMVAWGPGGHQAPTADRRVGSAAAATSLASFSSSTSSTTGVPDDGDVTKIFGDSSFWEGEYASQVFIHNVYASIPTYLRAVFFVRRFFA